MNDKYKKIRNFTIIAHVDHGKSTLSDYILKICDAKIPSNAPTQVLDDLKLEQERGITIKSTCVTLNYKDYKLHLIDSPGHRDFHTEVKAAVRACETAVLLVDVTSGVLARTLATLEEARNANLKIIPVLNKIDVADEIRINESMLELVNLGFDTDQIHKVSGKTGLGVVDLLNTIINDCDAPMGGTDTLQALVLDCIFDEHVGVRALVRIFSGSITKGDRLKVNDTSFNVLDIKVKSPIFTKVDTLYAGELGFIDTKIKDPRKIVVGDTISIDGKESIMTIDKPKPMVFCILYSEDAKNANDVKDILEKYSLNDLGFSFEVQTSKFYGVCFKCGFLGLLHMEIVCERLLREYKCDLVKAMPNVRYKITPSIASGNPCESYEVYSAYDWPTDTVRYEVQEPIANCKIVIPEKYMGNIYVLITSKRATNMDNEVYNDKIVISCDIPLAEVITGLYDRICTVTSGFGDFDYKESYYMVSDVKKVDIYINNEFVPELSSIVHSSVLQERCRKIVLTLKKHIERCQLKIKIQAKVGGKIYASEEISGFRKDVVSHCYGGDPTRKMKLWEQQKKGKKNLQERHGSSVVKYLNMPVLVREINV